MMKRLNLYQVRVFVGRRHGSLVKLITLYSTTRLKDFFESRKTMTRHRVIMTRHRVIDER